MVLVLVWFGLGSDPGFGLDSGFSSGSDLGSGSDSRFDIQFATDGSGLILVRIVMPVCSIWLIRYASQPIR